MSDCLKIGLTGGIGSGKSLALKEFARLGAATLSLDEVARRQARKGSPVHRAVVRKFGSSVIGQGGELDRPALAQVVFKSPARRRALERLTHPPILKEMRRWLSRVRGVAVVDVPLLFEGAYAGAFDATATVSAAEKTRLARICRRDRVAQASARRRMRAQLSDARREALADVVLRNEGTKKNFIASVRSYYRALELLRRGAVIAARKH